MSKKIADIDYGMVIDHITPGRGTDIANALKRIWQERVYPINTGEGHGSTKMGIKDFVKLVGKHLHEGDYAVSYTHLTLPTN